jgi:23S rRNA (adenine2030-N6)-methyltransferase
MLAEAFADDRSVQVQQADGFAGIRPSCRRPRRRGLLLMDPSYELKTDYAAWWPPPPRR